MSSGNGIYRCRYVILFLWLAALVVCAVYVQQGTDTFRIGGISDPASESAMAEQLMIDKLPLGGTRVFVLYESKHLKVSSPRFKSEVEKSLSGLEHFKLHNHVISPYDNDRQIASSHHAAYAIIVLNSSADEAANVMPALKEALGKPASLTMYVGGEATYIADVKQISEADLRRAELITLPICILALLVVFGGVVAALLPIISGVFSITVIVAILYAVSLRQELSIFALNIGSMLGLGLSMDYTLLFVSRFREELTKTDNVKEAIHITLATAGKSIFFSGLAVFISLSALTIFPINILYSMGLSGLIVVTVAVLSALVFLPALLCVLGKNVNALSIGFLNRHISTENAEQSYWFRFSMFIMRHPFFFFTITAAFLLLLGTPFLHVKINRSDASILPASIESRQLTDKFDDYFKATDLEPIYVVLKSKNRAILTSKNIAHLYDFNKHLEDNDSVSHVDSIVSVKPGLSKKQYIALYTKPGMPMDESLLRFMHQTTKDQYALFTVTSKYKNNDPHSFDIVTWIRTTNVGNHITQQVTGSTAVIIDTIKTTYTLFFKLLIIISVITYVVLLVLLRSLILPLKAIIMNMFSLLVSYGMLVYIYQEGHFANFLHFKAQGFIDLNLPVLLFFGLFGLSMDYEVFLLTRIKEFYDKTGDNTLSVALGLERSARIITSAALIIVIVSCAFVTADIVFVKAFGLGTALAVAVDATAVRILMVPATMRLLGSWNWYIPRWLDRILPRIDVL